MRDEASVMEAQNAAQSSIRNMQAQFEGNRDSTRTPAAQEQEQREGAERRQS